MATKYEIDQCLKALAVAYPLYDKQQANPDFALIIYHRILGDVDYRLLESATMQWLSSDKPFHPTPGQLRDMALTLMTRDELSADEAWSEVLTALRDVGYYRIPQWSSERIETALKAFGRWKDFCLVEFDQLSFVRAQFLKIYDAQSKRIHDDRLMLPETKQKLLSMSDTKALTGSH